MAGLAALDSAAAGAGADLDAAAPDWMHSVNGRIGGTAPAPLSSGPNSGSGGGLTSLLPQTFVSGHYDFTGSQDIDAVLIGSKWGNNAPGSANSITFSFPSSASFYGPSASYYDPGHVTGWSAFNAAQQTAARYAFSLINSYTNLTITEITETAGTHANVRLSQTSDSSLGSAEGNFPGSQAWDGDVWFGTSTSQPFYLTPAIGNWGQATVMHEIGHTMGLKHGHDNYTAYDLVPGGYVDGPGPRFGTRAITAAHDGQPYSLMTYRGGINQPVTFQGDGFNQPQTYMQLDIAALQYMYGADFTTNSTASVYTFSTTTGQMFINGVGQGAPTGNIVFRTIWDGNGVDTYDLSNYTTNMSLDLTPGGWSNFDTSGTFQRANNQPLSGGPVYAPGNIANALLYQGDGRSLIENANGGSGNDRILGNDADNVLSGNGGADTLEGALFSDTLNGGAGNDLLFANTQASPGSSGYGDSMDGGGNNDTITGSGGNDTISGGAGTDSMSGGAGNDWISQSFGGPLETMDGGTGTDTGDWTYSSANWTINLGAGTAAIDATTFATLIALENVNGGTGNDTIDGEGAANSLNGGDGNDLLDGAGGYNDTLNGGNGTDTVDYSWITSGFEAFLITIDLDAGTYTDTGGGETLISIENVLGTQSGELLIGGTGINDLDGNGGNDTIRGGTGYDLLDGGAGSDTYDLTDFATLISSVIDLDLGTYVESGGTETILNFENVIATGGSQDIRGTATANRLEGRGGDDILNGRGGTDSLFGGEGDDILTQGSGGPNETLDGGNGNDTGDWSFSVADSWNIDLTAMTAMIASTVFADLVSIENVIGGQLADTIAGDGGSNGLDGQDGADTINDGAGDDTVLGGGGNDRFLVGDSIVVGDSWDGGGGFDTWDASAYNFTSGVVIDLSTNRWAFGALFETIVNVEGVKGSQGGETIIGSALANSLDGQDGGDTINGGDGADTISGGNGSDALNGGNLGDTVMGVAGNDTLDGGQGADSLNGGADDDVILGGFGPDTMVGGPGIDTLDYSALAGEAFLDISTSAAQNTHSGGTDTLIGFENVITGGGDDRVFGSGQANRLETAAGSDTVKAADGNDSVLAGSGDDKVNGGGASDYIYGGDGRDQLRGALGADTFDYNAAFETGLGIALADVIKDFRTSDNDKIDLADVAAGVLAYIGAGTFSGSGAEVRVGAVAGGQLVQVDTDGDGDSDMDIYVWGSNMTGAAADFVL